ncbi:MAG: hypothetical protein PVG25_08210 [Anaerolineae bacterium]
MKHMACGGLALTGAGTVLSACAPDPIQAEEQSGTPAAAWAPSFYLPTDEGMWTPPVTNTGDLPTGTGTVEIERVGKFSFEAEQVTTMRPDIFQPGHFSLFDILVHLSEKGDVALHYHYDETMDTYVIDALGGEGGWWHNAYYSAGWFEPNVLRMDMYPYKNSMRIRLDRENEDRLEAIYRSFREEVDRLKANGGQVVIPDVRVRAPSDRLAFQDVIVTPHNVRGDVLQSGVVTGLDALISLAEQGKLPELKLTWYERIAGANPVDSYWVEKISQDSAVGGCGFVYETGPKSFAGFSGTHIHIPADVRVTVSPEYALWFWICLGRGGVSSG